MATGLLRIGFVASGRETQSNAFFSCPGIELLYSGVAIRTASARAIASRSSATATGASTPSSSSSYGGTFFRPPQRSRTTSSGNSSTALYSSFALYESLRRLPGMARTRISLGRLDEVELCVDRDVVGKARLAGRQRDVPVDAEGGPVDRRRQGQPDALAAVGVRQRRRDRAGHLGRLRDALDRQLTADVDILAVQREVG